MTYRNQIIAKAAVSSPLDKIIPGGFQKIGDDWVLFVEKISKNRQEMQNVFAAMIPNAADLNQRYDVVYAEKAFQKVDAKTHEVFVVLADGFRYVGRPGNNNYQIIKLYYDNNDNDNNDNNNYHHHHHLSVHHHNNNNHQ